MPAGPPDDGRPYDGTSLRPLRPSAGDFDERHGGVAAPQASLFSANSIMALDYLANLTAAKTVLWCYFIWYVVTVAHYFDASPAIWLNSIGISAIVGFALTLSVSRTGTRRDPWSTLRLFLIPFCVSSFSALTKDRGFWLVFPPCGIHIAHPACACAIFVSAILFMKRRSRIPPAGESAP